MELELQLELELGIGIWSINHMRNSPAISPAA
jgi:hypothetical protein